METPEDQKISIITTEDGSSSLYNPVLQETYHSSHGAIQESMHVFIEHGLKYWKNQNPDKAVSILEIGMGTGLNVLLTLQNAIESKLKVEYTTLEPFPIASDLVTQLNYKSIFQDELLSNAFDEIHQCSFDKKLELTEIFLFKKLSSTLQEFTTDSKFDIIYFDAFAPKKQSEMWHLELLQKLATTLNSGGVFTTYCAMGQLKRDLKACGLTVDTLQGPPGKNEMVRGLKK
jgi:tRNA U34 5-methylaminomethyl-2-thiouridine-forming methyltransferase MnmC